MPACEVNECISMEKCVLEEGHAFLMGRWHNIGRTCLYMENTDRKHRKI